MINSLYLPELRELLAENDVEGLREFCIALHPARTAEFMEGLSASEAWQVLLHAEMAVRVEIFGFFELEKQIEIVEHEDRRAIGHLIAALPADDRVDLLKQVDPRVVDELLPLIPADERRDILRLRAYPEGTAGSVMTSEFAKLPENINVRDALEEIGHQAEELETIYYVYIVDEGGHLCGLVTARQLISKLGKPNTPVSDLMERDLVSVEVTDDQELVAEKVARYDLVAIPVVDAEHHLLGIVTHDDVIDVVLEEAAEDAYRISAVEPLPSGYLDTHWLKVSWHRGIWLVILFFAALLTAFALDVYHVELSNIEWLVLFIPLVISSGGNSGSQSATLIITAMTIGDVQLSDWMRVVRRELVTGSCLGGFLGIIGYIAALFLAPDARSALVIPITILMVVLAGTLIGSVLPLIFRRIGWDPAMMSNPFVAGIIDILGIIIYMNVAMAIL